MYLANDDLENILGGDVLDELAHLAPNIWSETSKQIIEREVMSNLHIIRLSRRTYDTQTPAFYKEKRRQSDILRDKSALVIEYIRSKKMWEKTKGIIRKLPTLENRKYLYSYLIIGITLLFILTYYLISSIV